ncbi:hypothetical protein [Luteibacter sp. Sphag1AF]|uniref:hypothetical protein n=1 Tax=Luteibacter sp. Sphag1AF TaxID=2587031 RepID=UPI00160F70DF|nr:hypothetical protein [Luteibacter sp. Sphag1AF]
MRPVHKRYLREFLPAMAAYVVLMLGSVWLVRYVSSPPARAAITLLPTIPIAFAIRAMVRAIRGQDELERRIHLESFAIAGAVSCFGYFTYGLLLGASVLPSPTAQAVAIWVLPTFMGTFGVVKCLTNRRYRVQ